MFVLNESAATAVHSFIAQGTREMLYLIGVYRIQFDEKVAHRHSTSAETEFPSAGDISY